MFAGALTEKLLTFGLGRGVEHYDAPAVRKIVRDAGKDGYRFSSLILGIVKSVPFQMRNAHCRSSSASRSAGGGCHRRQHGGAMRTKEGNHHHDHHEEGTAATDILERRAALALPLLDAMIPAATAWAQTRRCRGWDSSICRWAVTTRVGPQAPPVS